MIAAEFPKTPSPKPARIPPQTPPAGGTEAEAGRIHIPSQMFRPASSIQFFSKKVRAKCIIRAHLFAENDIRCGNLELLCEPCACRVLIADGVYEPMFKRPRPSHFRHRAARLNRNRETRSTNPRPSQSRQIAPALETGTAIPPLPLQL